MGKKFVDFTLVFTVRKYFIYQTTLNSAIWLWLSLSLSLLLSISFSASPPLSLSLSLQLSLYLLSLLLFCFSLYLSSCSLLFYLEFSHALLSLSSLCHNIRIICEWNDSCHLRANASASVCVCARFPCIIFYVRKNTVFTAASSVQVNNFIHPGKLNGFYVNSEPSQRLHLPVLRCHWMNSQPLSTWNFRINSKRWTRATCVYS